MNIVIIGGGAAGFFAAINAAGNYPGSKVIILERGDKLLAKVKVSGGGRCNVTNACFEPKELVKNYPRGSKELVSCFFRFQPRDTVQWFQERGVDLVAEADGRMFPSSNSSQTIIDCFMREAEKFNVDIRRNVIIKTLEPVDSGAAGWNIVFEDDSTITADKLIVASGSSEKIWDMLSELGYKVNTPVPSLFTFNCTDERISNLPGISVPGAVLTIKELGLKQTGALLITHWGFSGPAILKLSAWGARMLSECNYDFALTVNWTGKYSAEQALDIIKEEKKYLADKKVCAQALLDIPQRLWDTLLLYCGITPEQKWNDISKETMRRLAEELTRGQYTISGKSGFKEEFVTCGGIELKQIDFKTMQSKLHRNIFFAGEVLDIDGITGGFNFQAAWTTAYISAV